jgi:type I restriction enzyme S subunit
MSQAKKKVGNGSVVGMTHTLKFSLPNTWQVVPLEEVLEDIIGGGTPSRDNPSYWSGSIPWLTVKDMRTRRPKDSIDHISEQAVRNSATNIIPADTVIIATRIGLGKVIRVPYDAAINQDLKALIAKPIVDKSYLEYWIYSIANYLVSIGSGTTVKGIRLEQVRSLPFPLAPLDQQQCIVAEIEKQFSRLDEAAANLKRVKANLKRYKAAVLKATVEGRLVETEAELARREGRSFETGEQLLQCILEIRRSQWKGKSKYKEPAAPDTTSLPDLPEGWVWASADQVMALITDGEHITPRRSESGVLLLSARNVWNGRLDLTEVDYIPYEEYQRLCKRLTIVEGDVLLSCSGSVGRSCVGPHGMKFSLVRSVAVLRPAIISSEFVCYQIQSPWLQTQIKSRQTQTAQANIFQGKIRQLPFALPPEAEQHRIVTEVDRRLSLLCEIEAQVDANLLRAERLRQSILAGAFSGRLVSNNLTTTSAVASSGAA